MIRNQRINNIINNERTKWLKGENKWQKNLKKKAFTLTELIVVIAIIGILAAVLIPSLTGYISKSKKSAAEQEAAGVYTIYQAWCMGTDEGSWGQQLVDPDKTDWHIADATLLKSFAYYYASVSKTTLSGNGTPYTVGKIKLLSVTGEVSDEEGKAGFVMAASNGKKVTVAVTDGGVTYIVE